MWFFALIFFLFYILAILQNSFFVHFSLAGMVPDLVFIAFTLFIFFEKRQRYLPVLFYAVSAGLFLDAFSYHAIGPGIAMLAAVGLAIKKLQDSLKETNQPSLRQYLALFAVAYVVYLVIFTAVFRAGSLGVLFSFTMALRVCYNAVFATIAWYAFQKIQRKPVPR